MLNPGLVSLIIKLGAPVIDATIKVAKDTGQLVELLDSADRGRGMAEMVEELAPGTFRTADELKIAGILLRSEMKSRLCRHMIQAI